MNKQEKIYKLLKILSIVGGAFFLVILGIALFVFFTSIASNPEEFKIWLNQFGIFGRLALVIMMFLQVLVAFLPGEIIEVGAGVAYGTWEGMFLCLLGSALATGCILKLVKKYGYRMVEHFMPKEKIESLSFLKSEEKLYPLVFMIFFIPGTPKDFITYFAGLISKISTMKFVVLTTFARIPSVITSTIAGEKLMSQDFMSAFIIYGITLLISIMGIVIYRKIIKTNKTKGEIKYES